MLEEEAEEATQRKLEKKEMLPGSNLLGTWKSGGAIGKVRAMLRGRAHEGAIGKVRATL